MEDNGDISDTEVDSSIHLNKQLATALNMEKMLHARTAETLCRERQELMVKHEEVVVLKKSMNLIFENASKISLLFLNIFNEIQRVHPSSPTNVTNENSKSHNSVNVLKDMVTTSTEKLSPLKTLIQQEIENNESDAENVNNEPNKSNSQEEVDEETENNECFKKRRLETLPEETENCCNQENNTSFNNLSPTIVSRNETQITRSSRKLAPKRIPLAENSSLLANSPESFMLLQQNDVSKHSPITENVSNVLRNSKSRKSRTQRSNPKPALITLSRPPKRSKKELDSFEKVSELSAYNDCNIESPQNSEIQQDDITFNTFKKIPSTSSNQQFTYQTSTPYTHVTSTSNCNSNFITRRRNKLSDENNSPTSALKPCSVIMERIALTPTSNSMNMLTSQRDIIVDELNSDRKRSTRASKKSYKEPSLVKKLRRE